MSSDSTPRTLPVAAYSLGRLRRKATGQVLRVSAAAVALTALAFVGATPASAHDTTLPDAPYYRSTVTSISPAVPGLKVELNTGGETVTLTNGTGSTVMVLGYEGEDYLRITPTGVDENTNSLSAFLNGTLVIQGLPQQLGQSSPDQPPAWKHVADKPTYSWHDHRVHWMAQQQPPVVAADSTKPQHVFDWTMQLEVAGKPVAVKGSLDWIGQPRLTGLPLALLVLLSVTAGLCLTIVLVRLHLKRKDQAAARGEALPAPLAADDELLPAEPARSSLTETP